jgi:hypothetical protein
VAAVAWRGKGKREQRLGKVCENGWDNDLYLFFFVKEGGNRCGKEKGTRVGGAAGLGWGEKFRFRVLRLP